MKNIVLVRIDDRLIHGQIMTQWSRLYSPTEIMVVDDETCRDSFMTEVLLMAVPKEFKAVVADVDRAAEYLLQEAGEDVGGMCKRAGRSTLYRNISSSPAENETLLRLQKRGVRVYVQVVPEDKEMEIDKVL